jgi:hypothetical protein
MTFSKLFINWETKDLYDQLYFLESQVYTTRNQFMITDIKAILKSRKSFDKNIELYKEFI